MNRVFLKDEDIKEIKEFFLKCDHVIYIKKKRLAFIISNNRVWTYRIKNKEINLSLNLPIIII